MNSVIKIYYSYFDIEDLSQWKGRIGTVIDEDGTYFNFRISLGNVFFTFPNNVICKLFQNYKNELSDLRNIR